MEIETYWALLPESFREITAIPDANTIVSPSSRLVCVQSSTSISFFGEKDKYPFSIEMNEDKEITCCVTISNDPWILCCGTKFGKLIFFNEERILLELSPNNSCVQSMKLCNFSGSQLTKKSNVLLVQYHEKVFAIIDIESLMNKINNEKNDDIEINIQKWQIPDDSIADSVYINSNLQSFMFSGLHKFPAIFCIGTKAFISVYSIPELQEAGTTEKVKQVTKRLFKKATNWIFGTESKEVEVPSIPNATFEWELKDEGRIGKRVHVSPTGRWIAITDNYGRVIIVDSIFGHIAKVLKGMRDAQIAWYDDYLLIFIPLREMIVSCTVPSGNLFDAVRVDKNGKLIQIYRNDNKYGAAFIDSKGNIAILKVNFDDNTKSDETHVSSVLDYHFNLPEVLKNESEPVIRELQKELETDPINNEAINSIMKKVDNPSIVAAFIRTLILNLNITDELILQTINYFKENIKTEPISYEPKSFFLDNNSSIKIDNGEFEYRTFIELTERWETYCKYQKEIVQYDDDLSFDLTPETNEILNPPLLSLKEFLKSPINQPLFFFSFLRNKEVKEFSIFESYFYSRCTKEEFIHQFLIWALSCSPAQLVVSNTSIQSFLSVKEIKEQSNKLLKQIKSPQKTYNQAYLEFFLNKQ